MAYVPLSRSRLATMKEAELRTEVLIPLFQRMGFRDVQLYHGGAREQGKDIVMWMSTPFGGREYYGAVVKAGPVTGQANGRPGSAAEVCFQIRQALGSTFVDPKELKSRTVTKCLVVASGSIRKEAIDSLTSALAELVPRVTLIDGDELWRLLQEHSPERTVGSQLSFASQVLDQLSPHHHVIAKLHKGIVHVEVAPKYPDAHKLEPLIISMKVDLSAAPTGRALRGALDAHRRLGTPISIPADSIQNLELPPLLQNFVTGPVDHVQLTTGNTATRVQASVVARSGLTEQRLDRLSFRLVRGGTEEIEIESVDSDTPWTFTIVLNRATRRAIVQFQHRGSSTNAKHLLEASRFADVLSRGGEFAFVNEATGIELFSVPAPQGLVPAPDPRWLEFLEGVVFLQRRCRVEIPLPSTSVDAEDANDVIELADQLRAGIWKGRPRTVGLTLIPEGVPILLRAVDPQGTRLIGVRREWFEVFGIRVPLGTVVRTASHMQLDQESKARLEAFDGVSDLAVTMESSPASEAMVAFTEWLTPEEFQSLQAQLPGATLTLPAEDE